MMTSMEYMIYLVEYMIKTVFSRTGKNKELCIKNRTK